MPWPTFDPDARNREFADAFHLSHRHRERRELAEQKAQRAQEERRAAWRPPSTPDGYARPRFAGVLTLSKSPIGRTIRDRMVAVHREHPDLDELQLLEHVLSADPALYESYRADTIVGKFEHDHALPLTEDVQTCVNTEVMHLRAKRGVYPEAPVTTRPLLGDNDDPKDDDPVNVINAMAADEMRADPTLNDSKEAAARALKKADPTLRDAYTRAVEATRGIQPDESDRRYRSQLARLRGSEKMNPNLE
jgi:hypothetical protein